MKKIEEIDNILPQTQCGLCGYDGCKPYASALIENNERIDRCLPGGIPTLKKIGQLLNKNVEPFLASMQARQKPPLLAVINDEECIGCTKCIQACPVDAIAGSAKSMHVILNTECTGCELCVEPCPMDCIDMIEISPASEALKKQQAQVAKMRYTAKLNRTEKKTSTKTQTISQRKDYIQQVLARARKKSDNE